MTDSESDEMDEFQSWNRTANQLISVGTVAATYSSFADKQRGSQQSVNPEVGVRDILGNMASTPAIFRTLTNFTVSEFTELWMLVCATLDITARSTGEVNRGAGRKSKLISQQRLLNTLVYLKHDNTVNYESFNWNWARSSVSDDVLFVCSVAMASEIQWPDSAKRAELAQRIPEFPGCIGLIDGTLCKISRPLNNPNHRIWFDGPKKIYSMNYTVVVDHDGLFIFIDPGFPGSYHDVTVLRHSHLYENWRG
jgi:DDE superfamily endonuclease